MKTLFILATAFTVFTAKPSFANSKDVTPVVLNSFQSSFSNAKEVAWSATTNYFKASFMLNGQSVIAFYKPTGEMIALSRNITSLQLPLTLQQGFKKTYKGYWITDLFEVANEDGTSYYMTLENADKKVVLQATSNDWTVYQKEHKK